jgi:hypothetical protein
LSDKATSWAWEQSVSSATRKLVLLCLCNNSGAEGEVFQSVITISQATGLKDDTVRAALAALLEEGFIVDTGQRRGATQQIKVFQLPEEARSSKGPRNGGSSKGPRNGGSYQGKVGERWGEGPEKTPENGELPNILKIEKGTKSAEVVVSYWNSKAPNIKEVQAVAGERERSLRARMNEPFFLANWQAAIDRIAESDFCTGRNDRGWVADFDFFVRPETVIKVMEGKYGEPKKREHNHLAGHRFVPGTGISYGPAPKWNNSGNL